jgi:hypothetical protein
MLLSEQPPRRTMASGTASAPIDRVDMKSSAHSTVCDG